MTPSKSGFADAGTVILASFIVGSLVSAVLLQLQWGGRFGYSYGFQLLAALGLNAALAVAVMLTIPRASFLVGAGALQIGLAVVVSLVENTSFVPYSLYFGLGLAVWASKLRDPYFATVAMVALGAFAYNTFSAVQPEEPPAVSYSVTAAMALAFLLRRMAVKKSSGAHSSRNGLR